MTINHFKEKVLESPGWRTFFAYIVPLASGVISGVFVGEITSTGGIVWGDFYKSVSFYVLIVFCIIVYQYNKAIYKYEKEVSRFLDSDYCIAYMRSKCLPEAAERYKELIRNGQGGELLEAMDELNRILR